MPPVNLGVNLCFAVKRYLEPQVWARMVREDLPFAVVYAGEHYAVDVMAGVVYALVAWWVLQRLLALGHARLERRRQTA